MNIMPRAELTWASNNPRKRGWPGISRSLTGLELGLLSEGSAYMVASLIFMDVTVPLWVDWSLSWRKRVVLPASQLPVMRMALFVVADLDRRNLMMRKAVCL